MLQAIVPTSCGDQGVLWAPSTPEGAPQGTRSPPVAPRSGSGGKATECENPAPTGPTLRVGPDCRGFRVIYALGDLGVWEFPQAQGWACGSKETISSEEFQSGSAVTALPQGCPQFVQSGLGWLPRMPGWPPEDRMGCGNSPRLGVGPVARRKRSVRRNSNLVVQ